MLHACHHQKTKPTPDEICSDFRRILRERATNHSQFYRYLSSSPATSKLTEKPDIISHRKAKANDTLDAYKADSLSEDSIAIPSTSDSLSLETHSVHLIDDHAITNHQHNGISDSNVSHKTDESIEWLVNVDPSAVALEVSSEEEPLNESNQATPLLPSMHVDGTNDKTVAPSGSPSSIDPSSPQLEPTLSCLGGGHVSCGIVEGAVSVSTRGGEADDNKSSVSLLSSSSTSSSSVSSVIAAVAINNNNKTCDQHGRNHSNYLTFVRATSSDRCSPKYHPLDPHQCECDQCCRQYNYSCVGGERDLSGDTSEVVGDSTGPSKNSEELSPCGEVVEENFGYRWFADRGLSHVKDNRRSGLGRRWYDSTDTLTEETSKDIARSLSLELLDSSFSCRALIGDCDSLALGDVHSEADTLNSGCFDSSAYDSDHSYDCSTPTNSFADANLVAVKYTVTTNKLSLEASSELVHQPKQIQQYYSFPCVDKLVKMYTQLLQDKKCETKSSEVIPAEKKAKPTNSIEECEMKSIEGLQIKDDRTVDMNRNSPLSDEGCQLASSPYSSDLEDNDNDPAGSAERAKRKDKVLRSSSSDSALDLDDELPMEPPPNMNTGRRLTLTVADIPLRPALLPVPEPHSLPDSPVSLDQAPSSTAGQTNIPSKVILEERIVEIPDDKFAVGSSSRRESAQSTLSDFNPIECGAVRFVRTPSVVVSDYSDDILCGVTLEEIEYFRQHRMRRRSSAERDDACSDVSAASSCSNLDYCGSTISGLDGSEYYVNGERVSIDRKISDCSTCSTVSGDDDDENSGFGVQEQDFGGEEQQQRDEEERLKKERKKIQVKARHPKFIN